MEKNKETNKQRVIRENAELGVFINIDDEDSSTTEITEDKAEELYKNDLENGVINTEFTPHYNSFNQYKYMLIDMGYIIN